MCGMWAETAHCVVCSTCILKYKRISVLRVFTGEDREDR